VGLQDLSPRQHQNGMEAQRTIVPAAKSCSTTPPSTELYSPALSPFVVLEQLAVPSSHLWMSSTAPAARPTAPNTLQSCAFASVIQARPTRRVPLLRHSNNVLKQCVCVCVFITAGPITKLCAWGRRRVEDMCYEIRRAEACVD
jgi:hypothetical protein